MSTLRITALAVLCLLLVGCAPVVGVKGIAALVLSLMAAAGAGWGMMCDQSETRVCQTAQALDDAVTVHVEKYHRPSSGDTVASLGSANRGNGVAEPDTVSHLNQGM